MNVTKYSSNAPSLLSELFSVPSIKFADLEELSILVVGAGTFPSFSELVQAIKSYFPKVKRLSFYLIDPDKASIEQVHDFKKETKQFGNFTINIDAKNVDMKTYLSAWSKDKFDLIYFERPDLSIVNMLFLYLNFDSSRLALSLQESIPYLRSVVKENTIIIASFLYNSDLKHFKMLLEYSFNLKTKTIKRSSRLFSCGLISVFNKEQLLNENIETRVAHIKNMRIFYCLSFIAATVIFLLTPIHLKVISFLFVIGQLFYHRYSRVGWSIKLLMLLMQALLIFL